MPSVQVILRILRIAGMISFNTSPNLLDVRVRYGIYCCWELDTTILVLFNAFLIF